jgi:hypothetical protein
MGRRDRRNGLWNELAAGPLFQPEIVVQILGTVDSRATENFFASRVYIHMDKIDAASRADPQLKEELP